MSRWAQRRILADRVVAVVLLALAAPVILALAVLVKTHDRGPAFVGVPRVGRGGRTFKMWKLRSMRVDAPDGRAAGVPLTAAHDPRITPVGAKMRAHHLDELPQLWNVVNGDMSLLGARPEAPDFVELSDPRWQAALAMPPGIAGPTQLVVDDWEREIISASPDGSRYVDTVLPVKLAIDLWYVTRSSPRLDALVLGALVRHLLSDARPTRLIDRVEAQVPETRAMHLAPHSRAD